MLQNHTSLHAADIIKAEAQAQATSPATIGTPSPTPQPAPTPSSSDAGLSTGEIVGIVIAVVLGPRGWLIQILPLVEGKKSGEGSATCFEKKIWTEDVRAHG